MNLTLVTEGTYLHVANGLIEMQVNGRKQRISPQKVERILITTRLQLTSDLVILALQHKIDILFLDRFGNPAGRIWFPALGSTGRIRKCQLLAATNGSGLAMVRSWVDEKIEAREAFLRELAKRRPGKRAALTGAIERMAREREKLGQAEGSLESQGGSIRGHEGMAGKAYFESLASVQPEAFPFSGRSFRPARDAFNCLLNYGYAVLYGTVEKACHVAGLDPHIGFLHRDGYNQLSFVYDFIEPYRVYVERVVVHLFSTKKINRSMIEDLENGVTLNKEGKGCLLDALSAAFEKKYQYRNRLVTLKHRIQLDAHRTAALLLEGEPEELAPPEEASC